MASKCRVLLLTEQRRRSRPVPDTVNLTISILPAVGNCYTRFGSLDASIDLPRSMDERSDIDYMIVFSENNATPQTYLNRLKVLPRHSSSDIQEVQARLLSRAEPHQPDSYLQLMTWLQR